MKIISVVFAAIFAAAPAAAESLLEATRPAPAQETCMATGTVYRLNPSATTI